MEPQVSTIQEAAHALKRGEAVIFPTDTVYGLGVAVSVPASLQVLYDLKKRERGKPIAWLVADREDLATYGAKVSPLAFALVRAFWPGPLTLIVKASDRVPAAFRSSEGTIGLRMPNNASARALIRAVGVPLATTSANLSGQAAPAQCDLLDAQLVARVAAVICDDNQKSGVASTVLDCTGALPVIVREGAVSAADILHFDLCF